MNLEDSAWCREASSARSANIPALRGFASDPPQGSGVGPVMFKNHSCQIKSIRVHHLGPGGYEVIDELASVVVLGIHLCVGTENGV